MHIQPFKPKENNGKLDKVGCSVHLQFVELNKVRWQLVIVRLAEFLAVALLLVLVNFILPRVLPGDPLTHMISDVAGSSGFEDKLLDSLRSYYGLDRPWHEQLWAYLSGLAHGELGYSYCYKISVWDLLKGHFPWTFLLTTAALLLGTGAGVVLGTTSAWRRGSNWDRINLLFMTVNRATPGFFTGILLLLFFGYYLSWFPLSGAETTGSEFSPLVRVVDITRHAVLPVLTLALSQLPGIFLTVRSLLVDVLQEDYIRLARLKGVSEFRLQFGHALRSVLAPVISLIGMRFSFAAGGTVIVETLFGYPGIGKLMYNALLTRDYPLLQGGFLLISLYVLIVNLLVDVLCLYLDPRLAGEKVI